LISWATISFSKRNLLHEDIVAVVCYFNFAVIIAVIIIIIIIIIIIDSFGSG
jgi:hypothetical protein